MKRLRISRPSPALVVASISLFVALGGVSYGVATGSIDSREIKDNSVQGKDLRSSSITARELRTRSLDGTDIKIDRVGNNAVKEEVLDVRKFVGKVPSAVNADSATNLGGQPASAFGAPNEVRFAIGGSALPTCTGTNLTTCVDNVSRTLGAGNWLIQSKLVIDNNGVAASATNNRCGLVQGTTVLDSTRNSLGANTAVNQNDAIALTTVVTNAAEGTTIGVRCTEQAGEALQTEDVKLTALRVDSVTGP